MDRSPPPLFKQGPSARVRLLLCTAAAIAMLLLDARLQALTVLRAAIGNALYPVVQLVLFPRALSRAVGDYFASSTTLAHENQTLRANVVTLSQQALRYAQLEAENAHLRKLLELKQHSALRLLPAEVEYESRDPYTPRIVIDQGSRHGIQPGNPVVDDRGVVGQVTRVFLLQSEVTLLTDKEQSIPVQILRNGLRSVAFGGGQPGLLELRYMAASADVQQDDLLVTSGLDGIYPPGLPVGHVIHLERKSDSAFTRIYCRPAAGLRQHRHLLVLLQNGASPTAAPALPAASASAANSPGVASHRPASPALPNTLHGPLKESP